MKSANRVIFYISNETHILDLAGAVQVFYECGYYGHPYEILYVSDEAAKISSANMRFAGLMKFTRVKVLTGDIVVVPGFDLRALPSAGHEAVLAWLRAAHQSGATICSVCTGSFMLARAGLLDGTTCTTHWKYTDRMQQEFPKLNVLTNRLFVNSGNIYTSAGLTTGIDMMLFLLEQRHGPEFVYRLARELVVYIRRDGGDAQESVYLQYRSHINEDIHKMQDWIIRNLDKKIRVEALAEMAYMSPRNLTRLFKSTTGITIGQYIEKLRVEKAVSLLHQQNKIGSIAKECGLQSDNQLRTILRKHTGHLPSALKK